MRDEEQINPGHNAVRQVARVIGPLLVLLGGGFFAVGLISFFSSMGGPGMPQYFWCCFVAGPVFVFGVGLTNVGYWGVITRYFAGEVAPVQKDTFNYLANGIRPGVKDLTQAVSEGLRAGQPGGPSGDVKYCSSCGQSVSAQANFCSACGLKLE